MSKWQCTEHSGKTPSSEGWFLAEIWASGKIGLIGDEPFHPYCAPIPFATKEAARAALDAQKPKCKASGNDSLAAVSREAKDLVIAHDVWDHAWLRKILEPEAMRKWMLYRLPDGMVEDPDALFEASLRERNGAP